MVTIELQTAQDLPLIETLLDHTFGPDRFKKASYALRDGAVPVEHLSFVARSGPSLVGTLRFWQVGLKDLDSDSVRPVLYLGPIAINPMIQGQGAGARLLEYGIAAALASNLGPIFLVGSKTYYGRHGFQDMGHRKITLPGGLDGDRLQVFGSPEDLELPRAGELQRQRQTCLRSVRAA